MSCEASRASVRPESVPVLASVVIVPRLVACTALAIPVTVCVVPPPPIGRGGRVSCAAPVMGHASRLATSMAAPVAVRRKESALRIWPPLVWDERRHQKRCALHARPAPYEPFGLYGFGPPPEAPYVTALDVVPGVPRPA